MLQATVNSQSQSIIYKDELLTVRWETKNNEGTSFSASIPNVNAVVTFVLVDTFLSAVQPGDTILVKSDTEQGLTLTLHAIETTPLKDKGIVEISCSGNFFTETNSIFGTLKIDADTWANTQAKYGLQAVEMHEANRGVLVNVRKKEDIALGVAWGFDTRRNISVTPFTTADGSFASDGVGVFEDDSAPDSASVTPLYKIEADQIIDYSVAPAEPPVTHLQTTLLGKLGPIPDIQPVNIVKKSGTTGSIDIQDNVKMYYIEETGLAAMYIANEDDTGTIVSQTLKWSDGFETTWLGSARKKVIGIFSDAYACIVDSTTVELIDRETNTRLSTFTVRNTSKLWDLPTEQYKASYAFKPYKTNKLMNIGSYVAGDPNGCELLWFRSRVRVDAGTGTYGDMAFGFLYSRNYENNGIVLFNADTRTDVVDIFINSCKVTSPTQHYTNRIAFTAAYAQMIEYDIYGSGGKVMVRCPSLIFNYLGQGGIVVDSQSALLSISDLLPAGRTDSDCKELKILDYLAPGLPYVSAPVYLIGYLATNQGEVVIGAFEYTAQSTKQKILTLNGVSNATWLVEPTAVNAQIYQTDICMIMSEGSWQLLRLTSTSPYYMFLQSGNILDWAGEKTLNYVLGRGVFFGLIYRGDAYWEAFIQTDLLPFISRLPGELATPFKIAEGNTNVVPLAFKVGPLLQIDADTWDNDKGRIELSISEFYVQNNATGAWIKKSIQDLNLPATASYVKVYLAPQDSQPVLVKITGCSISYSGKVTEKITGIIVE